MDEDKLITLRRLASKGSRSAALFLKDYYHGKDSTQVYKYTCYSALSGDLDSAIELYHSELPVLRGFADEFVDPTYESFGINHMILRGTKSYIASHTKNEEKKDCMKLNEGYIHPGDAYTFALDAKTEDPADIIKDIDSTLAEKYPSKMKKKTIDDDDDDDELDIMVADIYDPEIRTKIFSELDDSFKGRYWRAMFRYLAIGTKRDEESALREMLELSEEGFFLADDALVFMTDFHPESYRQRYPMHTEKQLKVLNHVRYKHDPRASYYRVADGDLLEISVEWMILTLITGLDEYGYTFYKARENKEGGYEDDIIYTHIDDQFKPNPPTFVFKPSGYSMGWYKYAWRSPEQNENLSIGEILRIWRLCIEHVLWGREIPRCSTEEILKLPISSIDIPKDIEERVKCACAKSILNISGFPHRIYEDTFTADNKSGSNEKRALKLLRKLQ